MTPAVLEGVFIALAALSAVALWRLADPNSRLSRLVDGRPADTTRKAQR